MGSSSSGSSSSSVASDEREEVRAEVFWLESSGELTKVDALEPLDLCMRRGKMSRQSSDESDHARKTTHSSDEGVDELMFSEGGLLVAVEQPGDSRQADELVALDSVELSDGSILENVVVAWDKTRMVDQRARTWRGRARSRDRLHND